MRMLRMIFFLAGMLIALAVTACGEERHYSPESGDLPNGVEAVSLDGRLLYIPTLPPKVFMEREGQLARARELYRNNPGNAEALIWYGRRCAYLGRYREALAIFSEGIEKFPDDARMYRHRGHRYITTRQLDRAIADLDTAAALIAGKADRVEPDGLPNARNIPTSTLQGNIWYHLGLAYYLKGDFSRAQEAYHECLAVAKNPDMLSATTYWLYLTLRRLERDAEAAAVLAPIEAGMDIIENVAYHRLLLLYKGEIAPEDLPEKTGDGPADATLAYGLAMWHYLNGDPAAARRRFETICATGDWPAFGHLAAEAELLR